MNARGNLDDLWFEKIVGGSFRATDPPNPILLIMCYG